MRISFLMYKYVVDIYVCIYKEARKREIEGVSITCMQTNVQWPAYVASRYPLWPSVPECPSPGAPSQLLRHIAVTRNLQNHNLKL